MIGKQKYLELVSMNQGVEGLRVLRNELTTLDLPESQIRDLAFCLMMPDPSEEFKRLSWDGPSGKSRHDLLVDIQGLFLVLMPYFIVFKKSSQDSLLL